MSAVDRRAMPAAPPRSWSTAVLALALSFFQ